MTDAAATLLFVGQAVLDQVFQVDRFSAAGGKGLARGHAVRVGGLATHAARAAHRLRCPADGPRVRLVSAVGADAAGDAVRQALVDDGLDDRGLARVDGARTGVSAVLVDAAGERQVHHFRGDALVRAAVPENLLPPGCAGVLVDPRWPEAAARALRQARAAGVVSVLDAEVAPREVLQALLPLAAWCVFSRQGLAAWLGEGADRGAARPQPGDADGPPVPLRALARAGAAAPGTQLVVTLGAEGALWRRPDGHEQHLPAFAVQATDTNGAGDVMHGALLLSLAEGLPPEAALRRAMAAAALACCGSLPDRASLNRWMETHR